jgi:hypothetical protein
MGLRVSDLIVSIEGQEVVDPKFDYRSIQALAGVWMLLMLLASQQNGKWTLVTLQNASGERDVRTFRFVVHDRVLDFARPAGSSRTRWRTAITAGTRS